MFLTTLKPPAPPFQCLVLQIYLYLTQLSSLPSITPSVDYLKGPQQSLYNLYSLSLTPFSNMNICNYCFHLVLVLGCQLLMNITLLGQLEAIHFYSFRLLLHQRTDNMSFPLWVLKIYLTVCSKVCIEYHLLFLRIVEIGAVEAERHKSVRTI